MSEIVGTAYVRIKALTSGLNKEIEKGVKKGLEDANLENVAKPEGAAAGKSFGEEFSDSSSKSIEKGAKKSVKDADLKNLGKAEASTAGKGFGDKFADSSGKTLKKRSKDVIPTDDLFAHVKKDFESSLGQLDFGDFIAGIQEDFSQLSFDLSVDDTKARKTIVSFGRDFGNAKRDIENRFGQLDFDDFFNGVKDEFTQLEFDIPEINLPDIDTSDYDDSLDHLVDKAKKTGKDIDNGSLPKSLKKLSKQLTSFGKGNFPSLGLLGGKLGLLAGAVVAILPYIQDLGAGLLAYATGLVAQIGFLSTAMIGLGAAAGAAIGSIAISIVPLVLAFKAPTEALDTFKDRLAASGEEFMRIGVAVQQTLFPALDSALSVVEQLVPMFMEFGLFVGNAVGSFAQFAAAALTSTDAQERWKTILRSSLRILDLLLPMLLNVGSILSGIWVAAAPVAEKFAGLLGGMVQRWSELINVGLETGTLTETLTKWYDRAVLVGGALGDLVGALFDVLEVGADSSDSVFERFADWAKGYREWTESEVGQNKLKTIFDNALAVMHEINGIAADLFDGIFGRIGEVGGVDSMVASLEKFREKLPEIQAMWAEMYDAIKKVTDIIATAVWDKLKRAFEELKDPIGRLVFSIIDFFDSMNQSGAFEVFLDLIGQFTDILSVMLSIPGFAPFIGYLIAFGGALKIMKMFISPVALGIGAFGKGLAYILSTKTVTQMLASSKALTALSSSIIASSGIKAGSKSAASGVAAAIPKVVAPALGAGVATGVATVGTQLAATQVAAQGTFATIAAGLGSIPIVGWIAIAAITALGAAFLWSKHRAQEYQQQIRNTTKDLGIFNGGIGTSAASMRKFLMGQSDFNKDNRIVQNLDAVGLSVSGLSAILSTGKTNLVDFVNSGFDAGEFTVGGVYNSAQPSAAATDDTNRSLAEVQKTYDLTDKEITKLINGFTIDLGKRAKNGITKLEIIDGKQVVNDFRNTLDDIGGAAKDTIDTWSNDSQVNRLFGVEETQILADKIAGMSDREAGIAMAQANVNLTASAKESLGAIREIYPAIVEQSILQATAADGVVNLAAAEKIAFTAMHKQNMQMIQDMKLVAGQDFAKNFPEAKKAVFEYSAAIDAAKASGQQFEIGDGIDEIANKFPAVTKATSDLFVQLSTLPETEFNAVATSLGVNADVLRDAMKGAEDAISDLQNTALSKLPSIGQLLDDATQGAEDGTMSFGKGFEKAAKDRIKETVDFNNNIIDIKNKSGIEAAMLAAEQGPKVAAELQKLAGSDPDTIKLLVDSMKATETMLSDTIERELGPGIRSKFATQAGLLGNEWPTGFSAALDSPQGRSAMKLATENTFEYLKNNFQGQFVIDEKTGVVSFKPKPPQDNGWADFDKMIGIAGANAQNFQNNPYRLPPGSIDVFAHGGFIGNPSFSRSKRRGGPRGTDTVPAWLTPGEFVLRRAVAQSLPKKFLNALNSGDPRIIAALNFLLNKNSNTSAAQTKSLSNSASNTSMKAANKNLNVLKSGDPRAIAAFNFLLNKNSNTSAAQTKSLSNSASNTSMKSVNKNSDFCPQVENLFETFGKVGWGITYPQTVQFVASTMTNGRTNFLKLPKWMLEALRQYGTFFEDFAIRMNNDPRGPYLGSKKTNPWGLPPGSIDIFAREHGGPTTKGKPYIVGERGPELFVPNESGQIIPHGTYRPSDMTSLLDSLNKTRPGASSPVFSASTVGASGAAAAGGNMNIGVIKIESPAPLESARMVADRLRIMQSQLSRR